MLPTVVTVWIGTYVTTLPDSASVFALRAGFISIIRLILSHRFNPSNSKFVFQKEHIAHVPSNHSFSWNQGIFSGLGVDESG